MCIRNLEILDFLEILEVKVHRAMRQVAVNAASILFYAVIVLVYRVTTCHY